MGAPLVALTSLRGARATDASRRYDCTTSGTRSRTLALQAAVPVKVVSEMLGHASVTIAYDTYSHVIPGMAEDATSKVAALLFPVRN